MKTKIFTNFFMKTQSKNFDYFQSAVSNCSEHSSPMLTTAK